MIDFLFQYSIFAAKVFTIIIALMLTLSGMIFIITGLKNKKKENLEIENLNAKYNNIKETLETEILTKEEFKILQKKRKKINKKNTKIAKKNKIELKKNKLYLLKFNGDIYGEEINSLKESITAVLSIATKNDEILIIIDSPGGLVHNYGFGASQLHRIKQKNIKLTVSIDLIAASGGYMMACVADHIIAAPFAIVGSIGVLAQIPNFNRLLAKYDIDIEHHTAGDHKTTLTMLGKNTEKDRKKFKKELINTHTLFKEFVKYHREKVNIDEIATGEHWYGTQALKLNLIDEIITSDDYISNKLNDMDIYEIYYRTNKTIKEKIKTIIQKNLIKYLNIF